MEENGEFDVYKSKDVPFSWRKVEDIVEDAVFYEDGGTRFQQGELGNCWLAAAIESLRQDRNKEAFREVVQASGEEGVFRFWHKGAYQQIVRVSDAVPTENGALVFMRNVNGSEYWGILLEKAYAKWVRSYEGLEGGFWTDAVQSFTGGVVERIKLQKGDVSDNLFDIMLNSYDNGSSLCCIKKDFKNTEYYHSCCINAVKIEEGETKICILDPQSQEYNDCTYEDFIEQYHRLDMCHKNLDSLSALWDKNTDSSPWTTKMFDVNLKSCCDEFTITLTDTDDDQEEEFTFVVELVQKIKPDEGEDLKDPKPLNALTDLELKVGVKMEKDRNVNLLNYAAKQDEGFAIKWPQETHCFRVKQSSHVIQVTTDEVPVSMIYMRIFCKREYEVKRKEQD